MNETLLVAITLLAVGAALVAGAGLGLARLLGPRIEGAMLALAGGALIVSVTEELARPAISGGGAVLALPMLVGGAAVFALLDLLVEGDDPGASGGGGLLLAITLDGVPESLALGVALIGAGPVQVLALSGSIFLSNLPEAAGGARAMAKAGHARGKVLILWTATALLLGAVTVLGWLLLNATQGRLLAGIRAFAAGAVVASLATEVIPKAFREDHLASGLWAAIGVALALGLAQLDTA